MLAAGLATSFAGLLIALTIFFPASGMFVSLTQAALMDSAPDRRAQHMARWTLAGSIGRVAGPLLVAVVLGAGGSWRLAFVLIAGCGVAAWLRVAWTGAGARSAGNAARPRRRRIRLMSIPTTPSRRGRAGEQLPAIVRRSGALRWLTLLEVANLLLDVLTPFLALYLVAVDARFAVRSLRSVSRCALAAGLAGDVILIRVLARRDSRRVMRASIWLTLALLPAFLLRSGSWPQAGGARRR